MSVLETWIVRFYIGVILIWPIRWVVLRFVLGRTRFLTTASAKLDGPEFPRVSAVIPAKDEEATLDECLTAVRSQDYPNLEILVVDDRSDDDTLAIARRHESLDDRVRVVQNDRLPPGWTGKTYVLHKHAPLTDGEWLWFLDADTKHEPLFLKVMLRYALDNDAALVSLLPELKCETFWEQVVQPLAGIVLMQSFQPSRINDDSSKLAFANGQSILVASKAYAAAGGHRAVRDRFVEDIGLATKVKALGLPIRLAIAKGLVSCRMYASLGQLVRGWSRILYDALDRSPTRLVLKLLDPIIFSQSGHLALAIALGLLATGRGGPFAYWLLGLSLLHHALMYAVFHLIYNVSVPGSRYVATFPLGNLLTDYILIRAIRMCFTGKVAWRGTSYDANLSRTRDDAADEADELETAGR
ncbi:glycosyltransferase [Planctomyces sp. SH-PL62]|uniref:glycosyltransferase n=1 Tax=Planctomyces sp. SH-PL62 TaxID=1636152 RepID=UPI00078DB853|nr:glycosyltransferase family 2 protein [Planctomyces sp. SH-PL62]AMV39283.1 4,4'-diaponeurosporenoate glycosyltransferase [Planctomyces sp. SH-PL62]